MVSTECYQHITRVLGLSKQQLSITTSDQAKVPAELKHIIKRRKRKQK